MRTLRRTTRASCPAVIAALALLVPGSSANSSPLAASEVDPDLSTVTLSGPEDLIANGRDEVIITTTLLDSAGNPVPGIWVEIESNMDGDVILQPVAPTLSDGTTEATLATSEAGVRTLTAIADPAGQAIEIGDQKTVFFDVPQIRPNIVFLFIDDIGTDFLPMYDDLNPYRTDLPYLHGEPGQGDVPANGDGTSNLYVSCPTLQSLADEGVLFTNAYSMPLCSPARASLYTGEYPVRHGAGSLIRYDHVDGALHEFGDPGFDFPTLPEMVRNAAYVDAIFGKWHLGLPTTAMDDLTGEEYHLGWETIPARGHFSEWRCVFNNVSNAPHPPGGANGTYYNWIYNINHTTQAEIDADPDSLQTTYTTVVQLDDALDWCNSRTDPFLCVIPTNASHAPWGELPPPELTRTDEYMSEPLNAFSGSCAMTEALDAKIGDFINGLTPVIRSRTLFIVMGDNGTPEVSLEHARLGPIEVPDVTGSEKNLGQTYDFLLNAEPSRFKGSTYEKGIRVPLIVAGYGVINGGRTSNVLVDIVDIFPTIAAILHQQVPVDMHGISFLPVLKDQADYFSHQRDYTYSELFGPNGITGPEAQFTARRVGCSLIIPGQGRYKIIHHPFVSSEDSFYKLQDEYGGWVDPFETVDLPHHDGAPERANYELVRAKMQEVMASGDETGPMFCSTAENFCNSTPNSTGEAAVIETSGSCSVVLNDLVLSAAEVPDGFGIFFYAGGQVNGGQGLPFGNGMRCVGGGFPVQRLPIVDSVGGTMSFPLDVTNPPRASGQIIVGSTWHFQAWFRDPAGGGAQFDLSDGVSVTFGP